MNLRRAVRTLSFALACGALSPSLASAEEASEAAKKAARELGLEGIKLFDQEKYAEALDKLDRAYAVVHAPTLGLWSAQALVKLGRLVEASERYMEVRRMELPQDASAAFEDAQEAASREYEELQPRIPRIEIVVEGAAPDSVQIFVDDLSVPASLLGTPHPVDPGSRKVRARRGDETVEETVLLAEGEQKRVALEFPTSAAVPTPTAAAAADRSPEADRGGGVGQSTLGFIGIGVGGAGLILRSP